MQNTQSKNPCGNSWRRTKAQVAAILEEYRKSAMTQKVFARETGIGLSTLQLWLRQARRNAPSHLSRQVSKPSMAPVAVSLLEVNLEGVSSQGAEQTARYEIELRNGTRLRLPVDFGDESVRRLLNLLGEAR